MLKTGHCRKERARGLSKCKKNIASCVRTGLYIRSSLGLAYMTWEPHISPACVNCKAHVPVAEHGHSSPIWIHPIGQGPFGWQLNSRHGQATSHRLRKELCPGISMKFDTLPCKVLLAHDACTNMAQRKGQQDSRRRSSRFERIPHFHTLYRQLLCLYNTLLITRLHRKALE